MHTFKIHFVNGKFVVSPTMADAIKQVCRQNSVYNNLISSEECYAIIKKQLHSSQFDLLQMNIDRIREDKMGIFGDHLKLCAAILLHNRNGTPSRHLDLRFFIKTLPNHSSAHNNFVTDMLAFKKEAEFYSSLLCDLKKEQIKSKDVSEGYYKNFFTGKTNSHSWTCECYLDKPNLIVLEDLSLYGFRTRECRIPLDYEHCVLVLHTLARFHASSVIFEELRLKTSNIKVNQINEKYPGLFYETLWSVDKHHPGYKLLVASIEAMLCLLEFLPKYGQNSEYFYIIKEKLPQTLKSIHKLVQPSEVYRNVVCHGDLTTGNIMFRYARGGTIPVEARLVDFQLLRYNPPAHDVMCFLHLATTRGFRETNMDNFLATYYQSFSTELLRHDLDAGKLLPWSQFKQSCSHYGNVGRISAALYFQQILLKPEILKEIFTDPEHMVTYMTVNKSKELIDNYLGDPIYRIRNTEAIEEMIECCILNN